MWHTVAVMWFDSIRAIHFSPYTHLLSDYYYYLHLFPIFLNARATASKRFKLHAHDVGRLDADARVIVHFIFYFLFRNVITTLAQFSLYPRRIVCHQRCFSDESKLSSCCALSTRRQSAVVSRKPFYQRRRRWLHTLNASNVQWTCHGSSRLIRVSVCVCVCLHGDGTAPRLIK